MSDKLISVIMGIYNCAETLPEALDSIISQTYTNWELILCDDGSSDQTYAVAEEYRKKYPEKIILLQNEKNCGLNITLNRCLEQAHGTYIARMDGDDLSLPKRFEKEIEILETHPEFALVSTDMYFFDETGIWGRTNKKKEPDPADMVLHTPHCHAPCLVRKEAYEAVGGYSVGKIYERVEDRDLWYKMYAKGYRGMNLDEPLYEMRDDRNALSRRKFKYRINGFLVGVRVIRQFRLSPVYYIKALRPLVVGLLPKPVYRWLHKKHLSGVNKN